MRFGRNARLKTQRLVNETPSRVKYEVGSSDPSFPTPEGFSFIEHGVLNPVVAAQSSEG
jgi:hypothetical protein